MHETIKMLEERVAMLAQAIPHSLSNHNALIGRYEESKLLLEEAKKLVKPEHPIDDSTI